MSDFTPYHYFSQESDAITAYFKADADYSERLNESVTVYRSIETNEIVGCRLKGIVSMDEKKKTPLRDQLTSMTEERDKWRTNCQQATAREIAANSRVSKLETAIRNLLDDTQHADHRCGDADCPVTLARKVLNEA